MAFAHLPREFVKAQLGSSLKCHVIVYVQQTGEKQLFGARLKAADQPPIIFNYPANLGEM